MEEVQVRFGQWRQTVAHPGRVVAAAGELARQYGVNKVSRVLRLEFNHLKRMAESGRKVSPGRSEKAPALFELMNPGSNGLAEYTIELDGPIGTLRIYCKSVTAAELVDRSRALWSSAS